MLVNEKLLYQTIKYKTKEKERKIFKPDCAYVAVDLR